MSENISNLLNMKMKKSDYIVYIAIVIAVLLSVMNISFLIAIDNSISAAQNIEKTENKPAELQIITIKASSCSECSSIDSVAQSLKSNSNINITNEKTLEFPSAEASRLIERYGIGKLPTLLVLGEVNNSEVVSLWNENWIVRMENGTMSPVFYADLAPPYFDLATNDVAGMVSLTHIVDNSCQKCIDIHSQITDFFRQNGVKFSEEKTIDYTTQKAVELISEFGIKRIPAIIVSDDILLYPAVSEIWNQLNATEKEGFYALHIIIPPYRNLETGKLEGLVNIIYLTDMECADCYNVSAYKDILKRFGAVIGNESYVDVNSDYGSSLLQKYNITKIPTIIISPGASKYNNLAQMWIGIGDIADDGYFVMRNPTAPGRYRDIFRNMTVNNIYILGGEFEYQPSSIELAEGEFARVIFINAGKVGHDFGIDELGVRTAVLSPGQSAAIEFVADRTGVFSFYCSVEGHREAGMEGNLTIA